MVYTARQRRSSVLKSSTGELMEMPENTASPFDVTILSQIRECFCHVDSDPYSGSRIFLENAGGALTLKRVVEVVAQQTALPDNGGRKNPASREIDRLIAKGRQDLRVLLGARSGTILLGESTTSNAFRVLGGIIGNVAGSNVVTTNLDHPAIYDSTKILSERFGKEWRVATFEPHCGRVNADAVARLVDAETTVLALIHSSNITGARNDIYSIIQVARQIKPDLYVVVDGAQHGPHGLVDVEQLGCDAYFLSSYKLFSKVGASVAFLSERTARLPHDQILGKPLTDWDLGTREQAGYAAWSEAVAYLCWLGARFTEAAEPRAQLQAAFEAIELHERALISLLLRGGDGVKGLLELPHVRVYGVANDLQARESCVIFNVDAISSGEVMAYLGEQGIRVHNRVSDAYSKHTLQALGIEECVRVSLAHYNTLAEVRAFLQAMEKAGK